jgi:hypothetical protein
MTSTGPSSLFDLFEEETTFVSRDTIDIYDQLTRTIFDDDEDVVFQIQPTPIGSYGQVVVVPGLSAQDDSNLCDSGIACDFLALLSDHNTSCNKMRHCESSATITFSSSLAPVTKKRKMNSAKDPQAEQDGPIHHCSRWDMRFEDLMDFKETHGHCRVPNIHPPNTHLAQWVKRQRYQHKLKKEGKHATLSDKRQRTLESVGFVWDSHESLWMERWSELRSFFAEHAHSHVPTNYTPNRQLSIWVKCQRRQFKLYQSGEPSNMTVERVMKMESLNFNWNPRNLK